jgi:Putative amidase domain
MSNKPLTLGMVGEKVAALHQALTEQGFSIPDAETKKQFFGPATRMAVGEFQKAHGIDSSCEVCKATAVKLRTTLAENAANYSQPQGQVLTAHVGSAANDNQPPVKVEYLEVGSAANDSQPPVKVLTSQVGTKQQPIQPSSKREMPTHLSVFALAKSTGHPIARMPFYAEVGVVSFSALPQPKCNLQEAIGIGIKDFITSNPFDYQVSRVTTIRAWVEKLVEPLCDALYRLLAKEIVDQWVKDQASAVSAIAGIIKIALELAKARNLDWNNPQMLGQLLEEAILAYAKAHTLPLAEANAQGARIVWAHPLGVLATDHVGYLSYDLTRLPQDVADAVALALEARRRDPNAVTETSIWIYPMAREEGRIDALAQMRFAHDAIVVKLELDVELDPELCQPKLCDSIKNLGIMAMQNPDLTDWRLSPGSFATNPGTLVGADGCEMVLPSNIALHEFNFYQVIGLPAADVNLPIGPAAAGKVRPGFINEYRLSFIPIGHALGQIIYSMPLAPGETVNLAVIDWMRRDDALRTEDTKLDEKLTHEQHRDRTISETVNAAVKEYQHGSSFMAGIAGSYGAALGTSGVGAAIGLAGSLGGSTSNSSGTRDIAAKTTQKLSDNINQASTAMRELHSTVVVHSTQNEHEAIETRTVVNYNHSHSLTILYYEVLRHFRVVTEFVGRRPALLTNIHGGITNFVSPPIGKSHHEIKWQVICDNRKLLEAALLDDRYKEGFDIVERQRHRNFVAKVVGTLPTPKSPPDPPLPQGPEFRFFVFDIKTGGMSADIKDNQQDIEVNARLWPTGIQLRGGGNVDRLSNPGAFTFNDTNNSFVGHVPEWQSKGTDGIERKRWSIWWGEIDMITIWCHQQNTDVSFRHITVTAIDVDGNKHELVNKEYEFGDLVLTNDWNIDLPTLRPQPLPPPPGRPAAEIEEDAKFLEFTEHLLNNRAHYERALRLGSTPAQRAFELANLKVNGDASLLEKVDSRPLEVLGDYVSYPCIDPNWSKMIMDKIEALKLPAIEPIERLVTLPTRGVFSEAKLGHCNASEEIDETRFWRWDEHPIPHSAPEIAAIEAGKHTVKDPNLQSTPFPQSLVNIVNPPNAPDPTGLASAMNVLAASNIFRDMSGRAEVADLLKKLSDNSVAIAGVAQKAATGGEGSSSGGGGTSGGGGSEPPVSDSGTGTGQSSAHSSGQDPSAASPQQTPEQRASQQIDNYQKALQTARDYLPPDQQAQVRDGVTSGLANISSLFENVDVRQPLPADEVPLELVSYSRVAAITYAKRFWDRVCQDGFVALGSTPWFRSVPGGIFEHVGNPNDPERLKDSAGNIAATWKEMDDCTHFLSSCLGSNGGGLPIHSEFLKGPYGILSAQRLVDYLITQKKYAIFKAEKVTSDHTSELQPGDIIGHYRKSKGRYTHLTLYAGNGDIYCHTYSRSPTCAWDHRWDIHAGDPDFLWSFIAITRPEVTPSINL